MIAKKKMGKRISIEVIGHEGFNPTCAGKGEACFVDAAFFGFNPTCAGKEEGPGGKEDAEGFNPTCAGKDFLTSRDTGWLPEIHSLSLMGRVGGARLR